MDVLGEFLVQFVTCYSLLYFYVLFIYFCSFLLLFDIFVVVFFGNLWYFLVLHTNCLVFFGIFWYFLVLHANTGYYMLMQANTG